MKKKQKTTSGFTVPEMLVSAGIFLVILLLTMANLNRGNRTSELKLKALEVANILRQVQNYALSAQSLPSGNIPDRWGVHFSNKRNNIVIFAETDCSLCPLGSKKYYFDTTATDYLAQTINLSSNFVIDGMNVPEYRIDNNPAFECIQTTADVMDIVFTVPKGEIFVNGIQPLGEDEIGSCGNYNTSWVSLIYTPTGQRINIEINWISGKISTTEIN